MNKRIVEISSLDSRFSFFDDASSLGPVAGGNTRGKVPNVGVSTSSVSLSNPSLGNSRSLSSGRFVSVSVTSSAKTATVTYKPTQIARDERQERMNKIIRNGFVQGVRTTTE